MGTNFVGGGYAYTEADIAFDPVLRIDEVEKQGVGRISAPKDGDAGNLRAFPSILPPGGDKPRKT